MFKPPNPRSTKLLHDALTSLTVTYAHLQLPQRRILVPAEYLVEDEFLDGLRIAGDRLINATDLLREIELHLKGGTDHP